LNHFLNLLGAEDIVYIKFETYNVFGTVVNDKNNKEEQQDFCWHTTEENVPSEKVIDIINTIKANKFIAIDKISVSWTEIFALSKENNFESFMSSVHELLNVEIKMIDNGIETDSFFIHE